MKKVISKYFFLFSIASIIIVFDQLTKYWVRTSIPLGQSWAPWPWIEPFARFVHWTNTGAAFGIFQGFGDVFLVLSVLVSLAIIFYFPQVPKSEWPLRLAMGMQLGGAVGNLIDRVTIGHVTDFVSVGNFAVFNVADASISMGVAVLVLGVWIKETQERKKHPDDGSENNLPVDEQRLNEGQADASEPTTDDEPRVDIYSTGKTTQEEG